MLYREIQVRVMGTGIVDMVSIGRVADQVSKAPGRAAATSD